MIKDNTKIRRDLTRTLARHLDAEMSEADIKMCERSWWRTPWPYGGFCLTPAGAVAFDHVGIEFSLHPYVEGIQGTLSAGNLVRLSVLMPCPYTVVDRNRTTYIKVYDDCVSTLIFLLGDVDKYLQSLENE